MKALNKIIAQMYPSKIDENIPDGNKEKAYNLGYYDALEDVMEIVDFFTKNYPNIDPLEETGEGEYCARWGY